MSQTLLLGSDVLSAEKQKQANPFTQIKHFYIIQRLGIIFSVFFKNNSFLYSAYRFLSLVSVKFIKHCLSNRNLQMYSSPSARIAPEAQNYSFHLDCC